MIDADLLMRFAWALVAVLALIVAIAWVARRMLMGRRAGAQGNRRRLAVIEAAAIDGKSRLVLVRRDDTEHLLLVGQTGAVVVESAIRPVPPFAQHLAPVAGSAEKRTNP